MPLHSNLSPQRSFFPCSICNELVELETAKTDETGKTVHEECYVQKISLKGSIRPPPITSDARHNDNPLSEAIITLLDAADAHLITNICPVCGSQLERRKCIFFFQGQTWETHLWACLDCDTDDPDSPYDA